MNNCQHEETRSIWVSTYEDDWGTIIDGHWEYNRVSLCEDISTGRYQCTRCKEVMYYTGNWKKYHEGES